MLSPGDPQETLMIRTFYRILVATLALGAGVALSQSVARADMLTFIGPTPSLSLGGEYTSPYVFNINTVSTPVLLACDDFYSNISDGDSWTASLIPLVNAGGGGKFHVQDDAQNEYNKAGWLAQQVVEFKPNVVRAVLVGDLGDLCFRCRQGRHSRQRQQDRK